MKNETTMKIELIDRNEAMKKAGAIKEIAFDIAKANGTLPGYCSAPECKKYVDLIALHQLKPNEKCLVINNEIQYQLTDFELEGGMVIGKLCMENVVSAEVENNVLKLNYSDGIIETFIYSEDLSCWKFDRNNVKNTKHYNPPIN